MRVSLITTVLNEEKSIEDFLQSVIKQAKKPDEFIIVDGGSKDNTYDILKKYSKKYRWIRIFQIKGATIGKGRNFAVEEAENKIIASTDAGCILEKNWLKNIIKPFENDKVDVVVGTYKPYHENDFEYFQGLTVVASDGKIFNRPSRMSSRSTAFTKNIFETVGGYPNLKTGEDTQFVLNLIKSNARFAFAKYAVVYWKMRTNWSSFYKQFYNYGKGDRKSGNIWRMKINLIFVFGFTAYIIAIPMSAFINWIYFASLIALFALIFFVQGIQLATKTKKVSGVFYGFMLNLIKRTAYAFGVIV